MHDLFVQKYTASVQRGIVYPAKYTRSECKVSELAVSCLRTYLRMIREELLYWNPLMPYQVYVWSR